ncbi:MAG: hypothetical protein K2K06_08390 [Oscillospiraceae bacterium]|nr:hypothetical protein [Oscillospiraceae bacterium]
MQQLLEKLKNISIEGRMAFIIMCIESYLITQCPYKDWSPLSEQMWKVTNSYWDEWLHDFIEIIPECVMTETDTENTKYNTFKKLYKNLPPNILNDINALLNALEEMVELFVYTTAFMENASLDIIKEIVNNYLQKKRITIPDVNKVTFSKFEENDGLGKRFDGEYLSIIL